MGTHLSLTLKTPDKMRVLLALTLLVAGALAGGKEKREMEMWMKMKAMEGCFGEDLVKDHMIMMKKMFSEMMDGGNRLQKRSHHEGDENEFDLGSKLHEKLEHKKEHMEEMYGNMTCMLRECQVLDSENKFYP